MQIEPKKEKFMKKALFQAGKGKGRTSPNPSVGAVIVRDGEVIAAGFTQEAGSNHAEVEAIKNLGGKAEADDILYVTLEPCNHYGRTPPCTKAILDVNLKNVVIGMQDPNPRVEGGGAEFLRSKGVNVESGVLGDECRLFYEDYIKFVSTGRPFVIAKSAMTLDGWIATSEGHSQWITNSRSRQFVHELRSKVDAVMVGVGTIIADDPQLTARLENKECRNPVRIVVDSGFRTPRDSKILNHDSDSKTIVVVGDSIHEATWQNLGKDNISILPCPLKREHIDLNALMDMLGDMSITSILLEGGSDVMGAMIRERLIDKFYIFKAPKILGGGDGIPMAGGTGPKKMDESLFLKNIDVERFGDDVLIIGYPEKTGNKA
jgi:diaminohydroxyphosphoribosylaminopyrimidine deaminase/5-amino-6-(5-phosphoribosylamino)uracil reductase